MVIKKKCTVLLVSAVCAALCAAIVLAFYPGGHAFADESVDLARTFDSSADFSVAENGYRNWYYMSGPTNSNRTSENYKLCTEHFNAESWRGDGAYTVIFRDETVINNHDNGPIRAFKAPYSGKIAYTVNTKLGDGSPAVNVWIMHNDTELDAFAAQRTSDAQTYNIKTYNIDVSADDYIYYVTAPGESNVGGNSLKGVLRVVYTELSGEGLSIVNALSDKISTLPDASTVTANDYESVKSVLTEINAVDRLLRSFISNESENKLTDVRIAVYARKAEAMIDAIPDDLSLDDEQTVTSAREFYETLKTDEKSAVNAEEYEKLITAEQKVYGLYVTAQLQPLVDAIPDTVTGADKATVLAAKQKYDEFTDEQKKYISSDVLAKLNNAVEVLIVAESEARLVYDTCFGFSTVQGKNGWRYGTAASDGIYTEYAMPKGDSWDSGDFAIISERKIHPGAGHTPVRKFIAPYDGVVTLSGSLYKETAGGDCIIDLGIYLNGKNLFDGVAASVTPEECTPQSAVEFSKTDISVKAGDEIAFIYAHRGAIDYGSTVVQTSVTYSVLYDESFSGIIRRSDGAFREFPNEIKLGETVTVNDGMIVYPSDASEEFSYSVVKFPDDNGKAVERDIHAFISDGKLYVLSPGKYTVYAYGNVTDGIIASKSFVVTENITGKSNNSYTDFEEPHVTPQTGNGNWYYMHGVDGNFEQCERIGVFDGVAYYQGENTYTLINGESHVIGAVDDLPVTAWKAPISGNATVSVAARLAENSHNLAYEIWHNAIKIKDAITVSSLKCVGTAFEISVQNGDFVYIVVKDAGAGIASSKMLLTANVEYKTIDMTNVSALEAKTADLPSAENATAACKPQLEDALAAWDALSAVEKAFLPADVYAKLAVLSENMPAYELSDGIEVLPALDDLTADHKDEISALLTKFYSLNESQKAVVKNTAKLVSANNKLIAIEVVSMIEELPDNIVAENELAVDNAQKAYDLLTTEQKQYVSNYAKLQAATLSIAEHKNNIAEAQIVENKIDDIPETVTIDDKIMVELAKHAYDSLTTKQKDLVSAEKLNVLNTAVSSLAALEKEYASIRDIIDAIEALPLPQNLTLANKKAVDSVKAKYDDLTTDQKQRVTNAVKLADILSRLDALIVAKVAAQPISALVENLPEKITFADKAATENARKAYTALSADAQSFVDNIGKLELAEATIARIDGEIKYVTELINALDKKNLSAADKDAVLSARAAYSKLDGDAQAEIKNITILETAERKFAETEKSKSNDNTMDAVAITFTVIGCVSAVCALIAVAVILKKKKRKKAIIEQGSEINEE